MKKEEPAVRPIRFDGVADLYDAYVTADLDIAFFLQEARESGGSVLELACGTGRVSVPLLQAGVDLTCVDYSPGMLAQFRSKLSRLQLACRVVEMDMTALSIPGQFDLIFIPFHSFQEIVERPKQQAALERIARQLKPSGRFLCTLQNPAVRLKTIDGAVRALGSFPLGAGGSLEVTARMSFDPATRLAAGVQQYYLYDQRHALLETRSLDIRFTLFAKEEFEELAGSAGFSVEALYGDYGHAPFHEPTSPFMIWRLRKRPVDGRHDTEHTTEGTAA